MSHLVWTWCNLWTIHDELWNPITNYRGGLNQAGSSSQSRPSRFICPSAEQTSWMAPVPGSHPDSHENRYSELLFGYSTYKIRASKMLADKFSSRAWLQNRVLVSILRASSSLIIQSCSPAETSLLCGEKSENYWPQQHRYQYHMDIETCPSC